MRHRESRLTSPPTELGDTPVPVAGVTSLFHSLTPDSGQFSNRPLLGRNRDSESLEPNLSQDYQMLYYL
jgi:hypothetical protein